MSPAKHVTLTLLSLVRRWSLFGLKLLLLMIQRSLLIIVQTVTWDDSHTCVTVSSNVLAKLTWPRQQFVPDTVSCTYFQELLCCLSWVEWRAPSQVETQTNGLIFQTNLKVTQEALSQSNEYERLWDTVKTRATSQGTSNVELSFCTIQVLGSSLTVRLQLRQVDYFIIWIWLSAGVTGPRTPEVTLLSWQGCHVFQLNFLILLR